MDQYSSNSTTTIPSHSSSSPPPFIPLFLDTLPFLSPSSLLSFDPSQPLLTPPPPPPPPHPSPAPPRNSKKRSRASRRAPTTVLTTDASNFRAMVQEFTGIPSPPFSTSSPSSSLPSLPLRSPHPFPPPFITRPLSHKHQTITTPNTFPLPPLSSSTNTFLQSFINTQPVFAAKPSPYPSPTALSTSGREELQQTLQGATMLDSWICSSDYK